MKDYDINELIKYRASHSAKETADFFETSEARVSGFGFC